MTISRSDDKVITHKRVTYCRRTGALISTTIVFKDAVPTEEHIVLQTQHQGKRQ